MYSDALQASLLPQINNEEVQSYFLQGKGGEGLNSCLALTHWD